MSDRASNNLASSRPEGCGLSTLIAPQMVVTSNLSSNLSSSLPSSHPQGMMRYVPASGPLAGVNPLGAALLHTFAPVMHQTQKPHLTPAAFRGRKLRSGKWIREEEDYAELLIGLFGKGQVGDCENGCTLRSFLSRKLHCAPMRISKKYAGKGIGKMVYLSKLKKGILIPGEAHEATEARLKATEERFYHAVSPGAEYHDPFEAFARRESAAAGVANVPAVLPGILPRVGQSTFPFQIPLFNPEIFPKQILPAIAPTPTLGSVLPQVTQTLPVATPAVDPAKLLLHQSFMNALKQNSSAPFAGPSPHAKPTGSHTSKEGPTQHPHASSRSSTGTGERSTGPCDEAAHSLSSHTVTTPAPSMYPGAATPKTNELPDFLTGFDKVTKRVAGQGQDTIQTPPAEGTLHYSPPFTSQSFDDFHRFLGKDLSPLGETDDQKTSASSTRDSRQPQLSLVATTTQAARAIPEIDTMALFTAESYAMFAQESAMAASQHAAYFLQGDSRLNRSHSLDAGGVITVVLDQIEDIQGHKQGRVDEPYVPPQPPKADSLAGAHISSNGLTPVERLYGARDMNVVSGSEPSTSATETESSSRSQRESSSDRDVSDNISNDFTTDNAFSSNGSESGSSDCESDESPQRKKLKRTTMTPTQRDMGAERC